MLRLRRPQYAARFELTPLLDVIFLLLTFFIYAQVVMIRPYTLPVTLPQLTAGTTVEPRRVLGITLDADGQLYLNEKPTDYAQLRERLRAIAADADPPHVFLAMADESGRAEAGEAPMDRLPVFIRLMNLLRASGVEEYSIVGRPVNGEDSSNGDAPVTP